MERRHSWCPASVRAHKDSLPLVLGLDVSRCDTSRGRLPVRRPSMFKRMSIDAHRIWSILVIPHEAGLLYYGVRSTYILGLQIGLNFVPATKTEIRNDGLLVIFCRHEIEFFL